MRCSILNDEKLIGLVSLISIDYMNQTGTFHIMNDDTNNQGKGVGTFATKEMLYHAFNNLNLNRVELYVITDNYRETHMYEKIGFIKEGTKR